MPLQDHLSRAREELNAAIKMRDWAKVSATAAIIAAYSKHPDDALSGSEAGSANHPSTTSAPSDSTRRTRDPDQMTASGDRDGCFPPADGSKGVSRTRGSESFATGRDAETAPPHVESSAHDPMQPSQCDVILGDIPPITLAKPDTTMHAKKKRKKKKKKIATSLIVGVKSEKISAGTVRQCGLESSLGHDLSWQTEGGASSDNEAPIPLAQPDDNTHTDENLSQEQFLDPPSKVNDQIVAENPNMPTVAGAGSDDEEIPDDSIKRKLVTHIDDDSAPTPFNGSELEDIGGVRTEKKHAVLLPLDEDSSVVENEKIAKEVESNNIRGVNSSQSKKTLCQSIADDSGPAPLKVTELDIDGDARAMKQRALRSGRDSLFVPNEEMENEVDLNSYGGKIGSQTREEPSQRSNAADLEECDEEAQRQTFYRDDGEGQISHNEQDSSTANDNPSSLFGTMTTMFAHVTTTGEPLISATLVEEEERDVVMAEHMSFLNRKWKCLAFAACVLVVALALSLSVLLTTGASKVYAMTAPSDVPSMQPSSPPSFDQRPTLEIVQNRGHIRCGLGTSQIESGKGFRVDLCRAVAAVLFGNPSSFVGVPAPFSDRYRQLNDREVDLLLRGDTHTIEREVKEKTTGSGFTFSSPYYYDGMAYFGDEVHLRCAEEQDRHHECSSLSICVEKFSTHDDYLQSSFPSRFIEAVSSIDEMEEKLLNGFCNVITSDRSILLNVASNDVYSNRAYIVGDKLMTKEPIAIVTRNTDREFSDIINWVVHALFYGEEQGLTKSSSLCQNYSNSPLHLVSNLNFMNAVYCVGNYGELYDGDKNNRGMNKINDGTTGMLYATPFGRLKSENGDLFTSTAGVTLLDDIREEGSLNCGVVVPKDFDGEIRESGGLVGMSVDYCRTLAAALFHGDPKVINLTLFSANDESGFVALDKGLIDVLAGTLVERKYDFESSSSFGGFEFSTPYYFGNETAGDIMTLFSLATREDDVLFSSFVNIIVLSAIYVQEKGIKRDMSGETWGIRDATAYSGSYDQIYTKHFGHVLEEDRGRNILNNEGGPQIHSFPSLAL